VTDVWRETEKKTWKFRFEKIDLTQKSWWAPREFYATGDELLVPRYDAFKATEEKCEACRKPSKHIYEQGWVCLNSDCRQYFQFADASIDAHCLTYCDAFLKERSPFKGTQPGPLRPALLTQAEADDTNVTPYDEAFRAGIVCPMCGCCSRRTEWRYWRCENSACDFEYHLRTRMISVDEAIDEGMSQARKKPKVIESVRKAQFQVEKYDVQEYILPGPDGGLAGSVRVFKPRLDIKQQADGPDDLFRELQTDNFKLTRNPTRNKDST
jgi:hypothetical protein